MREFNIPTTYSAKIIEKIRVKARELGFGEVGFTRYDRRYTFKVKKGWVKFEYKGEGAFTFYQGDTVYQPPEILHREIEHSEDLELMEITNPAKFKTVSV